MKYTKICLAGLICGLLSTAISPVLAEENVLHRFERQQLSDVYFSEGANAGDLSGDEVPDVVCGPYWYVGPDMNERYELYQPVPQDRNRYANNFFSWVYDFNSDGHNDIFVVGFPGTPAHVYENPGPDGWRDHWRKHETFDWVSNESPQLANIVGDERPELICTRDGFFGFATIDWNAPFKPWKFHPISEQIASKRFGHGLGIGDVNGDDRLDLIYAKGWFEQPESGAKQRRWRLHSTSFSNANGGAEMYAYDVDGDGDNDIITSHSAHNFGLGWYEQLRDGDEIAFEHHRIMGSHPSENKYGVLFSELHSVGLADMDGDGLKDIVTGKTYWSHHRQSPMWDAGAVVYWFKLSRHDDGVDWIPYQADEDAGIGRQISLVDVDQDGLLDMVVGGMKGAHVLRHRREVVDQQQWLAAQPKIYEGPGLPTAEGVKLLRGKKSRIDSKTGHAKGALEGESLKSHVSAGSTKKQSMKNFSLDQWSGNSHLWWTGAQPGAMLTLDLPEFTGAVHVEVVLTCARDYGAVQLSLDGQPLGESIDLYNDGVITTGVLSFPKMETSGRKHTLEVLMVGANPRAEEAYMFAIDYLRLRRADGTYVTGK